MEYDICSICIDKIDTDKMTTDCGHSFHNDCFSRWTVLYNNCPICRMPKVLKQKETDAEYYFPVSPIKPHYWEPEPRFAELDMIRKCTLVAILVIFMLAFVVSLAIEFTF